MLKAREMRGSIRSQVSKPCFGGLYVSEGDAERYLVHAGLLHLPRSVSSPSCPAMANQASHVANVAVEHRYIRLGGVDQHLAPSAKCSAAARSNRLGPWGSACLRRAEAPGYPRCMWRRQSDVQGIGSRS